MENRPGYSTLHHFCWDVLCLYTCVTQFVIRLTINLSDVTMSRRLCRGHCFYHAKQHIAITIIILVYEFASCCDWFVSGL
jgi:hypothetical protein